MLRQMWQNTIPVSLQVQLLAELGPMPSKKRKPKLFRAASAVKAAARAKIGTPPPMRVERADKKRKSKTEKHKPTLGKLLQDSAD